MSETNQAAERLRLAMECEEFVADLEDILQSDVDPQLPRDLVAVAEAYLAAVQEIQDRIDWLLKQDGHSHHQGQVDGLRFALHALSKERGEA